MRLNLKILKKYLPENFHCKLFGEQANTLNCPRPILCEADSTLKAEASYLLSVSVLPYLTPIPNCFLICIGNPIPSQWKEMETPILQIPVSMDFSMVFNTICQIYDHFDSWENSLRNELEKPFKFDIENILRLGVKQFENRIVVTDQSLKVIFSAECEEDSHGHPVISLNNEACNIGPEMTASVRQVCNLERQIKVPYMSSLKNGDMESYCLNLYPLGYFTGCISITDVNHRFDESDFSLADYYFNIFQISFEKYLHGFNETDSNTNNVLYKMLRHQQLTYAETASLRLNPDETWICFKLKEKLNTSCMPKEYMHATLCTFIPQVTYSAIYHQKIVGLLKLTPDDNFHDITIQFHELLERMNYTAGFSNHFTTVDQFDTSLIQADYCLNIGEQKLNMFDQNVLPFLLDECSSRMPLDSLTNDSLRRLIDYDTRKNTYYLKTLEVYLKNELSITPTAAELFIHRSSLLKRLDKLKQLLQDDLSDPNKRLYYRLWFAIRNKRNV
ncbi:MAG: helix-turn-helix domain-containing protein [Lachnospiraceae bacterium]|nr:helix-turn-helix domain-containing protein [Lachnospiraceae bacterium]